MSKNNISTLFGKYRCENKEKLLAELNINQTDEEELKYTLNKNQELVSSLFLKNTAIVYKLCKMNINYGQTRMMFGCGRIEYEKKNFIIYFIVCYEFIIIWN